MTTLNTIAPNRGSNKASLRLARGRGSGKGGTCGRGNKGQNARTGHKRYAAFEGGQTNIFMRTPKLRGFTSYNPTNYISVNLSSLEKLVEAGVTEITLELLRAHRVVNTPGTLLKILGNGTLSHKITVTADAYSSSARTAIESLG